ncbi:DUF3277 family protein [Frateuria aurantia]|uniref:DUF3277 domain-containing protein n=1 Tax=Frateuria aurantia (strain ATCC 33424 / DSM 6220 / KCTC 2777 / LMG 1558 / NBRC 3245 / NCIMB 13370) TaxID=767434 RepID=H8L675_FRAAD|nr:DUF3277 family protein [Frateuria aurantia]AFC85919.1 Protein of unknown function (DUF3277) [Frateuria aurantia DSM 6220]
MATYSFLDVAATITGVGGSFRLGSGAGVAEEGISYEMTEDKNNMTVGADGQVLHALHAGKSGHITIRLLKSSPQNAKLQAMYDAQSLSSATWGQNVISIRNSAVGDVIACTQVAFRRSPSNTYAKDPNVMEWQFDAGQIDAILGEY